MAQAVLDTGETIQLNGGTYSLRDELTIETGQSLTIRGPGRIVGKGRQLSFQKSTCPDAIFFPASACSSCSSFPLLRTADLIPASTEFRRSVGCYRTQPAFNYSIPYHTTNYNIPYHTAFSPCLKSRSGQFVQSEAAKSYRKSYPTSLLN